MSGPADWAARIAENAATRTTSWRLLTVTDTSTEAELASGGLDRVSHDRQTSATLRVHRHGRLGTATATYPTDSALLVEDALRAARIGPCADAPLAGPARVLPVPPEPRPRDADTADLHRFAAQTTAFGHRHGLRLHGTLRRQDHSVAVHGPDGTQRFHRGWWHQSLVVENDAGALATCTDWTPTLGLSAVWMPWLAWTATGGDLPEVEISADSCPVVLAPNALYALLSPLIATLSGARQAQEGPALHPALTLDDGAESTWPLRTPIDDEGTPTARLTLVAGGRRVARYHTVATAAAHRERPTGHGFHGSPARRRPLQPATPVLGAVRLTAAPSHQVAEFTDLIASVDSGVVIESLLGGHQPGTPDPVVQGRIRAGALIEGGRPVALLAGQPVALDLRHLLGAGFRAATETTWPVGRAWHGRLPFVLADGAVL